MPSLPGTRCLLIGNTPEAVDTAGPFSAVSLKQLKAPEESQGRLQDPSLQCQ